MLPSQAYKPTGARKQHEKTVANNLDRSLVSLIEDFNHGEPSVKKSDMKFEYEAWISGGRSQPRIHSQPVLRISNPAPSKRYNITIHVKVPKQKGSDSEMNKGDDLSTA
ncbi:hypothetical protein VULLAG_LOCUS16733 [Vulpes lagopus]